MTTLTGEQDKKIGQEKNRAFFLEGVFFPQGLPGLGSKKYNLLGLKDNPFFYYLQSVEEPQIALVLTDPFAFFPEYSIELGEEDLLELKAEKKEDLLVLTTVTFRGEEKGERRLTTNLAAPIIFNLSKKLARQIIADDKLDQMQRPLFSNEQPDPAEM